jgi:hypothetical protein
MPLPTAFRDGEDAWQKVRELTSPVHRVREVHTLQDTLATGHSAIELHAAFQQQHGIPFTELTAMVDQLTAIEHRASLAKRPTRKYSWTIKRHAAPPKHSESAFAERWDCCWKQSRPH